MMQVVDDMNKCIIRINFFKYCGFHEEIICTSYANKKLVLWAVKKH